MSKREYEKKLKKEQEATARVFKDFIDTFHNPASSKINKTFIRSSVLNAESHNDNVRQIYNPKPLIVPSKPEEVTSALECAKILKEDCLDTSRKQQKPKSNLELLKDELKQKHTERKQKAQKKNCDQKDQIITTSDIDHPYDRRTTNLYLTNINLKIIEQHLMQQFGAFGPLASVKIMWPRGEDKPRSTNCGFVAFMSRKDAERAFAANKNREDLHVSWGKPIEIPQHPVYLPNELLKLYLPPPQTGLPFCAQLPRDGRTEGEDFENFLQRCCVRVTVPLNRRQLMIVNRMVEFVIKEGPQFEALIMNIEHKNPVYQFLFDNTAPIHIYYRWKIYSILHSDPQKLWPTKPFRMFKGGSIWLPPTAPNYTQGMPEELLNMPNMLKQNQLTDSQASRLTKLIRLLTMNRRIIAEAMVFCLNHKNAILDCLDLIIDSLQNINTNPVKKIARLYLLSDVLSNCKLMRIDIDLSVYESIFLETFRTLSESWKCLKSELDRTNFKNRVLTVVRHWDIYQILPPKLMQKYESFFLEQKIVEDEDQSSIDEPLDGVNLLKRTLTNDVGPEVVTNIEDIKEHLINVEYFVPSKWDTIDPEEVEAQAVSAKEIAELEKDKKDRKKRKRKHRH